FAVPSFAASSGMNVAPGDRRNSWNNPFFLGVLTIGARQTTGDRTDLDLAKVSTRRRRQRDHLDSFFLGKFGHRLDEKRHSGRPTGKGWICPSTKPANPNRQDVTANYASAPRVPKPGRSPSLIRDIYRGRSRQSDTRFARRHHIER